MTKPWTYRETVLKGVGWQWSSQTYAFTDNGLYFPVLADGCCDLIRSQSSDGCISVRLLAPTTQSFLFEMVPNTIMEGLRMLPDMVEPLIDHKPQDIPTEGLDLEDADWDKVHTNLAGITSGQSSPNSVSRLMCGGTEPPITVPARTLRRMSNRLTDCSPKVIQRMWRLRRAMFRAVEARKEGWSDIALEAGFADQSHMIRECKDLTGLTPQTIYDHLKHGDVAVSFNTPI